MNITLWKAVNGSGVSINLNEFEPIGGYESFLKDICIYLDAEFVEWYQGIESGIGKIIYKGYKMTVFWTDFPQYFSFDCENKIMAQELQKELEDYFRLYEDRWASAWKQY